MGPSATEREPGSPPDGVRKNPDFTRLWAAVSISQLGTAAASAALPLVAVQKLGLGVLGVSLISLASAAAVLCVALPLGHWIEFRPKKKSMVLADLARASSALGLAVLLWRDDAGALALVVMAVITAACGISYSAASQALLPAVAGRAALVDANGRLQSSVWVALVVGPFVGAGLMAIVGPAWVFALDAFSFVVSAAIIRRIRTADPIPSQHTADRGWQAAFEGFRWIRSSPFMSRQLLGWFLFAGASAALTPLLSVWYLRDLGFTADSYALVLAVGSIGGVIGSLVVGPLSRRIGRGTVLRLSNLARAPWVFGYAALPHFPVPVASAALFFGGLLVATSMFNASLSAARQELSPGDVISRVTSLWFLAASVAQPLLIGIAALAAHVWGTRGGLVMVAGVVVLAVVIAGTGRRGEDTAGAWG